jgi:hypothetical protein
MAVVAQGLRSSFIVAMGDGADSTQDIASVFDDLLRRFALCQQPDDLPMTAGNRIFRFVILLLDLFETQMRFDRQTFLHDTSIQQEMVSLKTSKVSTYIDWVLLKPASRSCDS